MPRPRCGRAGVLVRDADGIEALLWSRSTTFSNVYLLQAAGASIEARQNRKSSWSMRKAAAGLPHSKALLRNIMRDTVGIARLWNAFVAVLAKMRDCYHLLLVGYVAVDL